MRVREGGSFFSAFSSDLGSGFGKDPVSGERPGPETQPSKGLDSLNNLYDPNQDCDAAEAALFSRGCHRVPPSSGTLDAWGCQCPGLPRRLVLLPYPN